MSRDPQLWLADIGDACARVRRYTEGMTFESWVADERTRGAVLRNLFVIGEAVKHLPEETRNQEPGIEWRRIAGLRDMLAHAYFGIDDEIVWDVVTTKVPGLAAAVAALRSQAR